MKHALAETLTAVAFLTAVTATTVPLRAHHSFTICHDIAGPKGEGEGK